MYVSDLEAERKGRGERDCIFSHEDFFPLSIFPSTFPPRRNNIVVDPSYDNLSNQFSTKILDETQSTNNLHRFAKFQNPKNSLKSVQQQFIPEKKGKKKKKKKNSNAETICNCTMPRKLETTDGHLRSPAIVRDGWKEGKGGYVYLG